MCRTYEQQMDGSCSIHEYVIHMKHRWMRHGPYIHIPHIWNTDEWIVQYTRMYHTHDIIHPSHIRCQHQSQHAMNSEERDMFHTYICHTYQIQTQNKQPHHKYECITHISRNSKQPVAKRPRTAEWGMSHIWIYHTYEWVMSHIWTYQTYTFRPVKKTPHIQTNKSCNKYECITHINEWCHNIISDQHATQPASRWMIHITCINASHIWTTNVTQYEIEIRPVAKLHEPRSQRSQRNW